MARKYITVALFLLFTVAGVKATGLYGTMVICSGLNTGFCSRTNAPLEIFDGCGIIKCNNGRGVKMARGDCPIEKQKNKQHIRFCDDLRDSAFKALTLQFQRLGTKINCDIDYNKLINVCVSYLLTLELSDDCAQLTCRNGQHTLIRKPCSTPRRGSRESFFYCRNATKTYDDRVNDVIRAWQEGKFTDGSHYRIYNKGTHYTIKVNGNGDNQQKSLPPAVKSVILKQNSYMNVHRTLRLNCDGIDYMKLVDACKKNGMKVELQDSCTRFYCKKGQSSLIPNRCSKPESGNIQHLKFCETAKKSFNRAVQKAIKRGKTTDKDSLRFKFSQTGARYRLQIVSFKLRCEDISYVDLVAFCDGFSANGTLSDGCNTLTCRNGRSSTTQNKCAVGNTVNNGEVRQMCLRTQVRNAKMMESNRRTADGKRPIKCSEINDALCALTDKKNKTYFDGCNSFECKNEVGVQITFNASCRLENQNKADEREYCDKYREVYFYEMSR